MGFDLGNVISEERYYRAFVCAICQNLIELDALVTTNCSHCFCRNCLLVWLEKSLTCPTCNRSLKYTSSEDQSMMIGDHTVTVQPLKNSQPLAHRILKQILIRCPLHQGGVACSWKGDYGDLQAHLLSSTAHSSCFAVSDGGTAAAAEAVGGTNRSSTVSGGMGDERRRLAASLKQEANSHFESKNYMEAKSLYTKAIEVMQQHQQQSSDVASDDSITLLVALYSNRAATHLQLQQYKPCLDDCQHVLQNLEPTNIKTYIRAARASVQLGAIDQATTYADAGLRHHPQNNSIRKHRTTILRLAQTFATAQQQLHSDRHADAKSTFGSLLRDAPSAIPFLLGAAEADLGLGLTDSAVRLTKRVLTKHAQNPRGFWIRGWALFLVGDFAMAIRSLREALRLDPDSDHSKESFRVAKKVEGWMTEADRMVFSRRFEQAVERYTNCIEAAYRPPLPVKSPLYAIVHTKRAEAYLRLKRYKESLKDCALVLYAQEDHVPAWLIRFRVYHGMGNHTMAQEEVQDLIHKFGLHNDDRLRRAYENADFLVRKERRTDFYKLLGVPSIASGMEIKKAYKQKALKCHPDKVPPGSSEEERVRAQQTFQLLGEGLEILSDDFRRQLYDEGYDPASIRERVEAAKQAAHNHRSTHH